MNKRSRIYLPYIQYISNIEKLSDDIAKEMMIKIAEFCIGILAVDDLARAHEKRFKDANIIAEKDKLLEPIYNAKNKVDAMIQLAFLVNKCTKPRSIKKEEKGIYADKDGLAQIYEDMNSKDEKSRKNAIKSLAQYTEEEFEEYYVFNELESRKEIFYSIKHRLLSEIIKELGEHSELYQEYIYGFIRDEDSYLFAINIPGHLGTYQFHIEPDDEKEILFNIDCYEVQHEYEQLAEGTKEVGKMTFLCTKEEMSDLTKIEEALQKLKLQASRLPGISDTNSENIFRKIFLYSILLGKNPRQELSEANESVAFEFINEKYCGLEDFNRPRTIEDQRRYKMIIENLKKFKKVYIASADTVDSKSVIESIIRECAKIGIKEEELAIEKIRPRS